MSSYGATDLVKKTYLGGRHYGFTAPAEAACVMLGIDLLVFRLGTDAALRLRTGRNRSRRPNHFVLSNNDHAGDRLLDHVDDRVLDRHLYHLSWRFSWCLPCRDLRFTKNERGLSFRVA